MIQWLFSSECMRQCLWHHYSLTLRVSRLQACQHGAGCGAWVEPRDHVVLAADLVHQLHNPLLLLVNLFADRDVHLPAML